MFDHDGVLHASNMLAHHPWPTMCFLGTCPAGIFGTDSNFTPAGAFSKLGSQRAHKAYYLTGHLLV